VIGGIAFGAIYLGWGPKKISPGLRRSLSSLSLLAFGAGVFTAETYWKLLAIDQLFRGTPGPFSVFVTAIGVFAVLLLKRAKRNTLTPPSQTSRAIRGLIAVALLLLGPVALMYQFGSTDYRQKADAVVVFGARVYGDGTPSLALADRIKTACILVQSGHADWIIASGGPGDGLTTEAQAMKAYAVNLGIDPSKVLLDEQGLNTASTCANTTHLIEPDWRLLAVSHSYHLPRVKLAFAQVGLADRVRTVPAQISRPLAKMPLFMAREVMAWWVYFFEPVIPGSRAVTPPAPLPSQSLKPSKSPVPSDPQPELALAFAALKPF